jgi:diguanylate cyclase (GGDEF)-like protein
MSFGFSSEAGKFAAKMAELCCFLKFPPLAHLVTRPTTNSLPGNRRFVRLLIAFVFTIVCLCAIAALVIYTDAHSSVVPETPVSHTQEVLLNLAGVSQQIDRVELDAQLYRLTGGEDTLRAAQGATVTLNTLLVRLQLLLRDQPQQERQAAELANAAVALTAAVNRMRSGAASVRDDVVSTRRVFTVLLDEEQSELAQRQEALQRSNLYDLARRITVIAIGTAIILTLFAFLMRDALRRGRFEEQISDTNERLRLTVQRLEEQAWSSRLLISARDEVSLCQEVKQAQDCTVRYLEQLLPGTAGSLCILNNSRQSLECVGTWGGVDAVTFDGFPPDSCCALRTGRSRWRRPERSEVHCTHFAGKPPERYLCLPLTAHGETFGIITVECPSQEVALLTELRETALGSLGEMAAMAIAGLNLRQRLESQSIRDSMTGLFNRSFMEIALEREMTRANRQGRQVAVMMIDIDHFKQFNDTFGHAAGDVVLREVAECMRIGVRGEDIVCRFGGEEFVVIMPEIATRGAFDRAELLRRMVGDLSLRFHGQPLRQITISIGVAMFPENSDNPEELLRSADHAMYAAKHKGRNRVVAADSSLQA